MPRPPSGGAISVLNTFGSMASTAPSEAGVTMAKDFMSVLDLSAGEIARLLDLARQMKADRRLGRPAPPPDRLPRRPGAVLFDKPRLGSRATCEIPVQDP